VRNKYFTVEETSPEYPGFLLAKAETFAGASCVGTFHQCYQTLAMKMQVTEGRYRFRAQSFIAKMEWKPVTLGRLALI
jgi:hypothetical protein